MSSFSSRSVEIVGSRSSMGALIIAILFFGRALTDFDGSARHPFARGEKICKIPDSHSFRETRRGARARESVTQVCLRTEKRKSLKVACDDTRLSNPVLFNDTLIGSHCAYVSSIEALKASMTNFV